MKLAFFDSASQELTSNKKGDLLEALTRRLVGACGYKDIHLRGKHATLEYDIEAVDRISGHRLYGEVKAHDNKIAGKELLAFIAKVLPFGQISRADALFVSVSDFQPSGGDYLTTHYPTGWILPNVLYIRTLVGQEIPRFLTELGQLTDEETIRRLVKARHGVEVQDVWLVFSDEDDFIVCTAAPNLVTAAQWFALLDRNGEPLALSSTELGFLKAQIADIRDLVLLGSEPAGLPQRSLPTVASGMGWFDYRFPASPEFFVGRQDPLLILQRAVEAIRYRQTAVRSIQIASRSGVGKSSLLLKLPESLRDVVAITVDGRSIRTPSDLRLLAAQFIKSAGDRLGATLALPRSDEEIFAAIKSASSAIENAGYVGLIEVDQFESTLAIKEVFNSVVDLVGGTSAEGMSIAWVFGRKNDIAFTPDATASLDLEKLNQLSHTVLLRDFSPEEGQVLLDQLSEALGEKVLKELAEAISVFSGGFPWLHKRLCAHVLAIHADGESQRDIVQAGLRAEDLFDSDLSVLSESDRALLRTLAPHLPNTAVELARRLEGEVTPHYLTLKLNEFLGTRLIRLSGDVYDTYNDVFKTYLVTGNIPFRSRYLFRVPPNATLELLNSISALGPMELGAFADHIGGNRIAVLNKLRELRLLGLIDSERGRVQLSTAAQSAINDDALGALLRQRLRGNGFVSAVLDHIAGAGEATASEVEKALRSASRSISASENTWATYTRLLMSWLHYAQLAYVDGELLRPVAHPPSDELQERRFNKATFKPNVFMPSVRPVMIVKLLEYLRSGRKSKAEIQTVLGNRYASSAISDAVQLDLVNDAGATIELGRTGRALVERSRALEEADVAPMCLARPNIKALLDAAAAVDGLDKGEQRRILEAFGATSWNDSTWHWRLGILRTWLVASGQAMSGRSGLALQPNCSPIDF
jgi:predicted transcriptional regulator